MEIIKWDGTVAMIDLTKHASGRKIIRSLIKKFPGLKEAANSIVLSKDNKLIMIFLYEDFDLPKTFKGIEVKGYI
jgi:hypothetical protein